MKEHQLTDFAIRRLKPGDSEMLYTLLGLFLPEHPEQRPDEKRASQLLERRDQVFFVATLKTRPVGWAAANVLPRFNHEICWVYQIDVLPAYQRQGIATALINHLQDWCRKQNIPEVFALANQENSSSIGLFAGSGGHPSNHSKRFYSWILEP